MSANPRSVLIVTRDLSTQGVGLDVRRLLTRLLAAETVVRVVCEDAEEPFPGISVTECTGLGSIWRHIWAFQGLRIDQTEDPPRLIHVLGADLCEAGISLAERLKIPYLLSVDEFIPPGGRFRISRNWCRGLVVANLELAEDLTRSMGVPADMIHVIPPGVATPAEFVRRQAHPARRISVVGTAGTLNAGSGFVTFLNAARRVLDTGFDAEFVVAGTGEEESDLRRRAERLKIVDRVTFAADSSPADGFWDVLDVYCQPSVIPTVGRGLRLALSHAVPSIASDIEGLRSLVEHDVTGLRVVPGDTNAMSKAVIGLLQNPDRAALLGQAGRDRVLAEYNPEAEVEKLLGLYDRAELSP